MGFECGFTKIKKLGDISPRQALAAVTYARYKKWLESEWAQRQIVNGHEFSFSEFNDSSFTEEDLPKNVDEYIADEESYIDDNDNYWCSIGHRIDDLVVSRSEKISEYDYVLDDAHLRALLEDVNIWLSENTFTPVIIKNAYRYNYDKDDSIKMYPVDGVVVEFEDGSERRIDSDEETFGTICIFNSSSDYETYGLYLQLKKIIESLLRDVETHYIYYYRSF